MPTIQGQMDVNGSSGPVAGALVVPVSCLTPAAVTFLWDLFRFLATAFLQGGTNCAVVTWPKKDKSKRTLSLRFVNYCPWNQTAPGVSAKKYSTTQICCTFSAISAKNDVPYTLHSCAVHLPWDSAFSRLAALAATLYRHCRLFLSGPAQPRRSRAGPANLVCAA